MGRRNGTSGGVAAVIVLVGVVLAAILILSYQFISSQSASKTRSNSNNASVKIVGEFKAEKRSSTNGLAGSQDLCWKSPECEGVTEKAKKDPSLKLTDFENKCLYECLPPPDSVWAGDRETAAITLNESQVEELVNTYQTDSTKLRNVKVAISGGVLYFEAVSSYEILAGKVSGEITHVDHKFKLNNLRVGKVPVPDKLATSIETNIDSAIIDALASFGVALAKIEIVNDKLILTVEMPKGLVTIEGETLVIDLDVIPEPSIPTEKDGFTIQ